PGVDIPIKWKAVRNTADHASIGGKADLPTLAAHSSNDKRKQVLSCDQQGSFRIRPYIDTNGNDDYSPREPSMPLNLILANAALVQDNSAGFAANLRSNLNAGGGQFSVRNGTWPDAWAADTWANA